MVRDARSVSAAIPVRTTCPGITVRSVVPSAEIRAFTDCWAPRPSATTAMTAPTPMTTPSIVRNDRSLFALRAPSATPMVSPSSMVWFSLLPASAPAPTSATGTGTAGGATRWRLLKPTRTLTGPDASLLRVTLRLENSDSDQRNLFAQLEPVQHLGVLEITDAGPNPARRVFVFLLYKSDLHRSAPATGPSRTSELTTGRAATRAAATALEL